MEKEEILSVRGWVFASAIILLSNSPPHVPVAPTSSHSWLAIAHAVVREPNLDDSPGGVQRV